MQFKSTKEYLNNPNDSQRLMSNTICIFDIEYEEAVELHTNSIFLTNFDGLSQLNYNNTLYFCGGSLTDKATGSYFLKYEPNKPRDNLQILVNSIQHHYLPAMISYKQEHIFIVGGLKTKSAEFYNLKTNRWRSLPDIDQERFNCMGIADETNEMIYIFGGYNTESNQNCSTIIRMNFRTFLVWESITVKANPLLLAKSQSAILKFEREECIYLLGGKDSRNNITDEIVEYDLTENRISVVDKKLEVSGAFCSQGGADLNKNEFFFFDDNFNVHKLSKNDFSIKMYKYEEIISYYD